MKRIIGAALALTLLGSTAAQARGWHDGDRHGGGWHHHGGDDAALGLGLGFLALGIIAAESAHDRDRDGYYRDRRDDYGDRDDGYRGDDRSGRYDEDRAPPSHYDRDDDDGDD